MLGHLQLEEFGPERCWVNYNSMRFGSEMWGVTESSMGFGPYWLQTYLLDVQLLFSQWLFGRLGLAAGLCAKLLSMHTSLQLE